MKMSNDLADMLIDTIDDRRITLADLVAETTDEEIEHFTSLVTQPDDKPELQSFTAWTKNKLLILYTTVLGSYLECYDRNYE